MTGKYLGIFEILYSILISSRFAKTNTFFLFMIDEIKYSLVYLNKLINIRRENFYMSQKYNF